MSNFTLVVCTDTSLTFYDLKTFPDTLWKLGSVKLARYSALSPIDQDSLLIALHD